MLGTAHKHHAGDRPTGLSTIGPGWPHGGQLPEGTPPRRRQPARGSLTLTSQGRRGGPSQAALVPSTAVPSPPHPLSMLTLTLL